MRAVHPIEVYSTCPPSAGISGSYYLERVAQIARWSEDAGCSGMLLTSDNASLDPWMLAQVVIQQTSSLCPIVAIQPAYMHPYWVAKHVASLSHAYGRRVHLCMVADGSHSDLEALDDPVPHDRRYSRLVEYATIVMRLVASPSALTYDGTYHHVTKLRLTPRVPSSLTPEMYVADGSASGVLAAQALGATAITYPKPALSDCPQHDRVRAGIRVGIVARSGEADAWRAARSRFLESPKDEPVHADLAGAADSMPHAWPGDADAPERRLYWLAPFRNFHAVCPYLVGSYEQVAEELSRYFSSGYRTVILDTPTNRDELTHAFTAIDAAMAPVR